MECIGEHEWFGTFGTKIDGAGDEDGIKFFKCECGAIHPAWIDDWNECIDIEGTEANNLIKQIGYEAYRKKIMEEDPWWNWKPKQEAG